MSKSIFLSISFKSKKAFSNEIAIIKDVVEKRGYVLNIFVEKYHFSDGEEALMMQQSCNDILQSKIVIAEVSDKAIGVGIEVGFAIGVAKPVIYLRRDTADYSKTIGGIVSSHIIYSSLDDLSQKLNTVLDSMLC